MDAKHTPGSWLASPVTPAVEQQETGRVVALCSVSKLHKQFRIVGEEAFANARLIAAAPDLLAALARLADASRSYIAHMDAEDIEALEAARAAIRKATQPAS